MFIFLPDSEITCQHDKLSNVEDSSMHETSHLIFSFNFVLKEISSVPDEYVL